MTQNLLAAYDALFSILQRAQHGIPLADLLSDLQNGSFQPDDIQRSFRLAVERDVIRIDNAMKATFNHNAEQVAA